MFPNFYPWQIDDAAHWLLDQDHFSHAWLIHGQEGIGKFNFAYAAAAYLLCENKQNSEACGECKSCHLISQRSHPDLRVLLPENEYVNLAWEDQVRDVKKPSYQIRLEQLRELDRKQFFNLSSHRSGYKVVIIYPVETMNVETSNALLKILEEPTGKTIFLMVSHSLRKLLPTIISRCRRLKLNTPDPMVSKQWLNELNVEKAEVWLANAANAPLKALAYSKSDYEPIQYWLKDFINALNQSRTVDLNYFMSLLDKLETKQWLHTLQCFLFDLLLANYQQELRYFPILQKNINTLAIKTKAEKTTELLKWLASEQKKSNHPLNSRLRMQAILQRIVLLCQ